MDLCLVTAYEEARVAVHVTVYDETDDDGEPPGLVSSSDTDDDDDDLPGLVELEEGCRQLELAPWSHLPSVSGVSVMRRQDGTLMVLDGNHRIQALQALYARLPASHTRNAGDDMAEHARLQAERDELTARSKADTAPSRRCGEDIARVKAAEEEIALLQAEIRKLRVCRGCQACMDSQPTP